MPLAKIVSFSVSIFGVVLKDVTEQKVAEEKFTKMFKLSPIAGGLSDLATGKYVEVNDAFYKLLGYSEAKVIGKVHDPRHVRLGELDAPSDFEFVTHTGSSASCFTRGAP